MYQAIWLPSALNDLMSLWVAADSETRGRITRAVSEIDRELDRNAPRAGESRDGGRRILFAEPLGIYFRVYEQQRIVAVSHVWQFVTH